MWVSGQHHVPAALPQGKRLSQYPPTEGCVDPRAGLGGCTQSRPHLDSVQLRGICWVNERMHVYKDEWSHVLHSSNTRVVPKVMSNFFLHANWEQQTKESAVVDGTSCCVILECHMTSIACIT